MTDTGVWKIGKEIFVNPRPEVLDNSCAVCIISRPGSDGWRDWNYHIHLDFRDVWPAMADQRVYYETYEKPELVFGPYPIGKIDWRSQYHRITKFKFEFHGQEWKTEKCFKEIVLDGDTLKINAELDILSVDFIITVDKMMRLLVRAKDLGNAMRVFREDLENMK